MKRVLKKIVILVLPLLIFTNVEALEECRESNNHKKYMEIPESERTNYIEPQYCALEDSNISSGEKVYKASNYPTRYNSKDQGYVTSVKNQGSAGTCWAFAATAAVESNALRNGLANYDLSEMHLLYSITGGAYKDYAGQKNRYNRGLNDGGNSFLSASYYFGGFNLLLENDWVYNQNLPQIYNSEYKTGKRYLSLKNYNYYNNRDYGVCSQTEINSMKDMIMKYGGLIAGIHLSSNKSDVCYKNGNTEYAQTLSNQVPGTDHAVLIIGWDDSISKNNFNNATRDGAWIIKNSWGSTWSGDGLQYVSYDDHFVCDEVESFTGVSNTTYDHVYKGAKYLSNNYGFIYSTKTYLATKITKATSKNEKIKRISIATAPNVSYTIYASFANDLTDTSDWKYLYSATGTSYGIESVDLTNSAMATNEFTIIVVYNLPLSGKFQILSSCKNYQGMENIEYPTNINYYSQDGKSWYDMGNWNISNQIYNCGPVIYVDTDNIDDSSIIYPTSISLNKKNVYLATGNSEAVTADILPSNTTYKTITWKSANNSIAKVNSNGMITGVGVGTTTITAETANKKSATVTVIVSAQDINPTGISLNKTSLTMNTEETATLTATITPSNATNRDITWISSNTNLATVQNGVVYAKAKGEVTITAKTSNNKTATCKIIINEKQIEVSSITFERVQETVGIGESITIKTTILPSNATNKKLTWESSHPEIATVDNNGKVTGVSSGMTTIKAVAPNGLYAWCDVSVVKTLAVTYSTHVQSIGWQGYVKNGAMSGTSGKALRLEAIKIKLENQPDSGDILYRTHIQSYGWESSFKKNNEMSGTSGEKKRLEAIEIKLTGDMANSFDVYYRVHAQHFGWLGWAKNGESAGTAGYAYRLEGIEIKLVKKTTSFPDYGKEIAFKEKQILYTTHVQSIGWQDYVADGEMAGTSGEAKRLEAIKIKLNNQKYSGDVLYKTHIQTYGWETSFRKNDEMSGTSGEKKRLEAIQIKLTGQMEAKYDIYYRVHAQNFGWLNWAKNGESAGTAGYAYRLEGIEIVLVDKGKSPPTRANKNNNKSFIAYN